ncbi:MAG: AMP-binding protein [Lentisphaeria bacterium]|nr:MAG: AMP-binding protein [Lentisphaeria bacterium]
MFPVQFRISVGEPISPELSAFQLRQKISELGADAETGPQPGEVPIHTAFAFQAKRHPLRRTYRDADGTAVSNFEQLVRALLLSRRIRELNEVDSGYIGVLLPNCSVMASLMLGVLFADRTPAVINFSAGAEVALDAARRAGITRILTSRKFLEKLGWEATPEMLFLEEIAKQIPPGRNGALHCSLHCSPRRMLVRHFAPLSGFNVRHEAVLLFSSGSTGRPKAIMLTHRNINCDLWAFWRVIVWERNRDRVLGNLPLFHAYGFTVQFAFPALSGTPVIYVPNPLDAATAVRAIAEYGVTLLTATPTFLQNYLRKAEAGDLRSLRLVITGAEKLRPELAARFHEMTGLEIIEGYGCTELSPIVTINLCNSIFRLGRHADHPGSIGTPLPGIHVRVVNSDTGVELGPNQPGHLQVKSGIVMKGYLNDPEQTARVIRDGYYDTGDIARIDEAGYVYITGRASRFSKIGGKWSRTNWLNRQSPPSATARSGRSPSPAEATQNGVSAWWCSTRRTTSIRLKSSPGSANGICRTCGFRKRRTSSESPPSRCSAAASSTWADFANLPAPCRNGGHAPPAPHRTKESALFSFKFFQKTCKSENM